MALPSLGELGHREWSRYGLCFFLLVEIVAIAQVTSATWTIAPITPAMISLCVTSLDEERTLRLYASATWPAFPKRSVALSEKIRFPSSGDWKNMRHVPSVWLKPSGTVTSSAVEFL
jgi:hypothetical protein